MINNESPLPAISFFEKKFKPIGACAGYKIASSFLAGHFIPAPFFNEFSSFPATCLLNFFKFFFVVRLLQKLGDADRRLTRQDRFFGHLLGSPESCPPPPRKAEDYSDDCPTNKTPNTILNLPCSFWFHLIPFPHFI